MRRGVGFVFVYYNFSLVLNEWMDGNKVFNQFVNFWGGGVGILIQDLYVLSNVGMN